MPGVNAKRIARAHRAIRRRLRRTQAEVSVASRVSRPKISLLENEKIARLYVGEVERSFGALGATVEIVVKWGGAELDRLLDESHALLVGLVVEEVRRLGWVVFVEVSFAVRGERGSIDVLAWHAATRTLLVIEVKSELGSLDGTLRPLDVKVRHAPTIAAERFGRPRPAVVGRVLVLPETSAARRTAARHAAVLATALPIRSREVRRWLAQRVGGMAGLWFLSSAQLVNAMKNPSSVRRVRKPATRAHERGSATPTPRRWPKTAQ
jgi:transcriptional regulator with XRE-family HTH domain